MKNIVIIFGGASSEYEVSLQSAYAVINNINRERYAPVMVGISRSGSWYYFTGDIEKIKEDTWCNEADCVPAVISPDRTKHQLIVLNREGAGTIRIDAVLPVMHGRNGEDGTVQGLVELAGIPLVGCGTLASALCMDKDRAHRLAGLAGVRVPRAMVLMDESAVNKACDFAGELGFPVFVKPVKAGSSYGVTKVENMQTVPQAVKISLQPKTALLFI